MNEENKYQIIKEVADGKMKKTTAEVRLNLSRRQINRLVQVYQMQGKFGFIHGNRSRKPRHAISQELKETVVTLYVEKYSPANFAHFTELLAENEGIELSYSAVIVMMKQADILSPKAHRITKRRHKERLKKKRREQIKQVKPSESRQLKLEESHPSRPRKKYFGELLQMDASVHVWFGKEKHHLHLAIDDATGAIVGARFEKEETLKGYYHVLHDILMTYGIPFEFLTDRRTVFEYELKKKRLVEEDTFTQFGYACEQLGIKLSTSSVPQAKGRVERLFGTLQSRLITELRLHQVSNLDDANVFLNSYIKKYNAQFASKIDYTKSVFEKAPIPSKINLILGVLATRKINNGHHFRFQNISYLPVTGTGKEIFFSKGTEVLVIQAFNGNQFVTINEQVYHTRRLEAHELLSKEFDELPSKEKKIKRKYIPPMSHPWKAQSFARYLAKHKRTYEETA